MSVYDPYYGRYSLYRTPSTRSYYSYGARPYSSYAASSPYSVYTDATSDYYSRSMGGGTVSEKIYFSLNGKLISSYKIRSYRVRRLLYGLGRRHPNIDFLATKYSESAETCLRLVSGHAARRRLFTNSILCYASWVFSRTIHRLQSLHIEEHVGN